MLKPFFWNEKYALYAWLMFAFILGLSGYTVDILVIYNSWNREFYDTLQKLQEDRFYHLLISWDFSSVKQLILLNKEHVPSFLEILAVYVPINVFNVWLTRRYAFKWREALNYYYTHQWKNTGVIIEGASQRIQEDTARFARTLESLLVGAFSAILVLIAFMPILWNLSKDLPVFVPIIANIFNDLPIWNVTVVPGFLVWIALVVSIGGTLMSFLIGFPLPRLEYNNQVVEAEFRKELVFGEDKPEIRDTKSLKQKFLNVRTNYYKLFNWYMGFGVWETSFSLVVGNIAIIVLAPAYFKELITLGILFQVLFMVRNYQIGLFSLMQKKTI